MLLFSGYLFYKREFRDGSRFIGLSFVPITAMMLYGVILTGKLTIGYSSVHNFYLATNQPELLSTSYLSALGYYFNYAFTNPLQFITDRLNSLWEFWGFLPSVNEGLRENLIVRLLIGIRFPLLLLAIYSFRRSKEDNVVIFSTIVIFSITILHVVFYSITRYNFVVEPFLIFLAVIGLKYLLVKPLKKE